MKKSDLKRKLKQSQIPNQWYSLDGGRDHATFCIGRTILWWEVYYSQPNGKTNRKFFLSETSACNYFYHWFTESLRIQGLLATEQLKITQNI